MLGLPDFRSAERTFQLLDPGRRTIRPRRPAGARGDSDLLPRPPRRPARLPARCRHLSGRGDDLPPQFLLPAGGASGPRSLRKPPANVSPATRPKRPRRPTQPLPQRVRLRGPAPAPLERIRGLWRWQILLSAANRELLRESARKNRGPAGPQQGPSSHRCRSHIDSVVHIIMGIPGANSRILCRDRHGRRSLRSVNIHRFSVDAARSTGEPFSIRCVEHERTGRLQGGLKVKTRTTALIAAILFLVPLSPAARRRSTFPPCRPRSARCPWRRVTS